MLFVVVNRGVVFLIVILVLMMNTVFLLFVKIALILARQMVSVIVESVSLKIALLLRHNVSRIVILLMVG